MTEQPVNPADKDAFMFPQRSFHGEFTPENLVFDVNLQEFADRVGIICALENGGKIAPAEAYRQIKELWQAIERSKQNLLGND